jgi:hypothetical protein
MALSEQIMQAVWEKGTIVPGQSADLWRKDEHGAWMGREFYGNHDSQYGWEIARINPQGMDEVSNLKPFQWQNSTPRINGEPIRPVRAIGGDNQATPPPAKL